MFSLWEGLAFGVNLSTLLVSVFVALFLVADRQLRVLVRIAIIWTAQCALMVSLVFTVVAAGRAGWLAGTAVRQGSLNISEIPNLNIPGIPNPNTTLNIPLIGPDAYPILGAMLGGLVGFAVGALALSFFFLLIDISENTRIRALK